MQHRLRRIGGDQGGAALIEFALSMPLLFLLIMGIIDFGLAFQRYLVLTNAAREGARMAVLQGYSTTDVEDRVSSYLVAGGVPDSVTPTTDVELTTIAPPEGPAFSAYSVTVQVPYEFSFLAPFGELFGKTFGAVTLTATSIMRTEVSAGG